MDTITILMCENYVSDSREMQQMLFQNIYFQHFENMSPTALGQNIVNVSLNAAYIV